LKAIFSFGSYTITNLAAAYVKNALTQKLSCFSVFFKLLLIYFKLWLKLVFSSKAITAVDAATVI